MDRDYENKTIALALRPVYITAVTEETENFLGRIGIFVKSVRPELLLDEKIFKYADKYSFAMAKHVNKTTARKIKKEILQGLKDKLQWNQISKNIHRKIFTDLKSGYRARLIARTEAHGMVENGSFEAAKASKIMKEKTWSSAGDARPTHGDANTQTVLIKDTFVVGGYQMDFPGDTKYGAGMEEIVHCRCSALYSSTIHKKRLTSSTKLMDQYKFDKQDGKYRKLFDADDVREAAEETKERICEELADRLMYDKDFKSYVMREYDLTATAFAESPWLQTNGAVENLINQWAATSGDFNPTAVAMQMSAKAEFGLTKVAFEHYSKDILFKANQILRTNGKAFQAFLRTQYNITQEFLRKNGIKSITSYRGMGFMPGKEPPGYTFGLESKVVKGKIRLQSMSSFTTNVEMADDFTAASVNRMIIQSEIPASRILSTCQTGYGCKGELEFVVLGREETVKILTHRITGYPLTGGEFLSRFEGIVPKPIAVPKWKPTMTTKEAKAWSKGSVYADDVFYHGTSKEVSEKMTKEGFNLATSNLKASSGKMYGSGHYVTNDPSYAGVFGSEKLVIKLKVTNPLTDVEVYTKLRGAAARLYESAVNNYDLTLLQTEKVITNKSVLRLLESIGEKDWNAIKMIIKNEKYSIEMVQRYVYQNAGYDALVIRDGGEIIIFGDKSLAIIK